MSSSDTPSSSEPPTSRIKSPQLVITGISSDLTEQHVVNFFAGHKEAITDCFVEHDEQKGLVAFVRFKELTAAKQAVEENEARAFVLGMSTQIRSEFYFKLRIEYPLDKLIEIEGISFNIEVTSQKTRAARFIVAACGTSWNHLLASIKLDERGAEILAALDSEAEGGLLLNFVNHLSTCKLVNNSRETQHYKQTLWSLIKFIRNKVYHAHENLLPGQDLADAIIFTHMMLSQYCPNYITMVLNAFSERTGPFSKSLVKEVVFIASLRKYDVRQVRIKGITVKYLLGMI